jgi:hypothetical protein
VSGGEVTTKAKYSLSFVPQIYKSYGTRPWQPVLLGLIVVLLFAVLFYWFRVFEPEPEKIQRPISPRPVFCMLYSIDTFVPIVTTTGVRNWGWQITDRYRWLEALERAAGVALSVAATISLATYL